MKEKLTPEYVLQKLSEILHPDYYVSYEQAMAEMKKALNTAKNLTPSGDTVDETPDSDGERKVCPECGSKYECPICDREDELGRGNNTTEEDK